MNWVGIILPLPGLVLGLDLVHFSILIIQGLRILFFFDKYQSGSVTLQQDSQCGHLAMKKFASEPEWKVGMSMQIDTKTDTLTDMAPIYLWIDN